MYLFSKMENKKVKRIHSEACYQWEERIKEKVKESECRRSIMYSGMKMEK
jgi:hypothetical protein